jgi:hypothetical protein
VSIRALAAAVRLSSSRVHQIVAAAGLDELDAALGELRAAGWPAPEDPDGDDDADLDGRELIADRLVDEAGWLRAVRRLADPPARRGVPAGGEPAPGRRSPRADAVGAWPSRTWISGSSAAIRRSRHPRNDPGTPTRPSGTAAGNATPIPATPRTRSVPPASGCNAQRG